MERTEQQSLPLLLREDRGAVSILTLNRPEKLNALAAEKSSFSKAEINIGIIPTFGGTQRLPRNVGRKAAIELIP